MEALGRLEGVHVAIVGDVLHSRVARSLVQALGLVGARSTLIAPRRYCRARSSLGCAVSHSIEDIAAADVVYVLRLQQSEWHPVRRSFLRCANTRRSTA